MKEWITFYKKVDKGMNGQVTGWLVFFIIPIIIATILLNVDIYLIDYVMDMDRANNPIPADLVWYKSILMSFINYFILGLGIFVAIIVIALVAAVGISIWKWLVEKFEGFQKFINVIKKAKTESFDNSNINLDPKKQEMNIKG